MKNYVVLGEKWLRAMVFANDAGADSYTERNCTNIRYQRYSEAEFSQLYAHADMRTLKYGANDAMAQALIVIRPNQAASRKVAA
ncbi:MAG TPA: hypothetical protein PLB10_11400 [Thiolinea sp.]|nr:hypothetical protein [Thiolinea sp.]